MVLGKCKIGEKGQILSAFKDKNANFWKNAPQTGKNLRLMKRGELLILQFWTIAHNSHIAGLADYGVAVYFQTGHLRFPRFGKVLVEDNILPTRLIRLVANEFNPHQADFLFGVVVLA